MNRREFGERLSQRYGVKNSAITEDLQTWLVMIEMDDYKPLYDAVVQNRKFETFPPISEIKHHYDVLTLGRAVIAPIIKLTSDQSTESILNRIHELRERQNKEPLTNREIDFLHEWDVLDYVREHLEKVCEWGRERYLPYIDKVRDSIARGEKFSPLSLPNATPEKEISDARSRKIEKAHYADM
jgi:hypothetical protein